MSTLTLEATLIYGDVLPNGSVPLRIPLTYSVTYTEESTQRVHVAAGETAFPVALSSITAPKFLLVRSLEGEVEISLVAGITSVPTACSEGSGYVVIANPNGQVINAITVTTPSSPASGALIEIIAVE